MNNEVMTKKFQSGQVVLILLLVITIGLGVGLSVIQRSITNVSTSTKVEESSRAFSAAEAGIEQAIVQIQQGGLPSDVDFTAQNQSKAIIDTSGLVPGINQIYELPAVSKNDVAHAWLANPATAPDPGSLYYNQGSLDIYWGLANTLVDPAIEVSVIYLQGGGIKRKPYYFDPDSARASGNGFCNPADVSCSSYNINCPGSDHSINTWLGNNRRFACKATLSNLSTTDLGLGRILLMVRTRTFYATGKDPIAYAPTGGNCGQSCSLPPQATIIVSTGTSGATQRRVMLFRQDKVAPWFFDYAIFSLAAINK